MPTCCTNCHKLLQRIVVLETKLFAGIPKQTEHTADGHHGPPQHTAGESCESAESAGEYAEDAIQAPGRRILPLRSSTSHPGTASPLSARLIVTLWSSETQSSGMSVLR